MPSAGVLRIFRREEAEEHTKAAKGLLQALLDAVPAGAETSPGEAMATKGRNRRRKKKEENRRAEPGVNVS